MWTRARRTRNNVFPWFEVAYHACNGPPNTFFGTLFTVSLSGGNGSLNNRNDRPVHDILGDSKYPSHELLQVPHQSIAIKHRLMIIKRQTCAELFEK